MATLRFKLADRTCSKTVDDGTEQDALERFVKGNVPYSGEWIEVDDGEWVRRDAIVSVRIADEAPSLGFA